MKEFPPLTIALFGEAEKGAYSHPCIVRSVVQLADQFGNPPEESRGIPLAIQSLLYKRNIIYVRVQEEGFSIEHYLDGLERLSKKADPIHAICLPGVGDSAIFEAAAPLSQKSRALLLTTEHDLYDLLTSFSKK